MNSQGTDAHILKMLVGSPEQPGYVLGCLGGNCGYWRQMKLGVHGAGGSRSKGASLLMRLHELQKAEDDLAGHVASLAETEQLLKNMSAAAKEHAK